MFQSSSVGTDIGFHNTQNNDYHRLPVTEKQLNYARQISLRTGCVLPWETLQDRQALSRWIDENRRTQSVSKFANYPSSKQVAFADGSEMVRASKGLTYEPSGIRRMPRYRAIYAILKTDMER